MDRQEYEQKLSVCLKEMPQPLFQEVTLDDVPVAYFSWN